MGTFIQPKSLKKLENDDVENEKIIKSILNKAG